MLKRTPREIITSLDAPCVEALTAAVEHVMADRKAEVGVADVARLLLKRAEPAFMAEVERSGGGQRGVARKLDAIEREIAREPRRPGFAPSLLEWFERAGDLRTGPVKVSGDLLFKALPADTSAPANGAGAVGLLPETAILQAVQAEDWRRPLLELLGLDPEELDDEVNEPELLAQCRIIAKDPNGDPVCIDNEDQVWVFNKGDGFSACQIATSLERLRASLEALARFEAGPLPGEPWMGRFGTLLREVRATEPNALAIPFWRRAVSAAVARFAEDGPWPDAVALRALLDH